MPDQPRIVDFHTHVFPAAVAAKVIENLEGTGGTRARTDATPEGLRRSMAESGVDLSVVLPVATNVRQVEKLNDISIAANSGGLQHRLLYFGAMHPEYPDPEAELRRIQKAGLKGIKIHPAYQHVRIDDPRYVKIMEICAGLGLIVVTHAGWDIGVPGEWCSPDMTAKLLETIHCPKLVLAHLGGVKEWARSYEVLAGSGVWMDTAMSLGNTDPIDREKFPDTGLIETGLFEKFVTRHGAEHILFATDSPWNSQGAALEQLDEARLSAAEKEMILGGNACRLLGL